MKQKSISYGELIDLHDAADKLYRVLLRKGEVEPCRHNEFRLDYVDEYIHYSQPRESVKHFIKRKESA